MCILWLLWCFSWSLLIYSFLFLHPFLPPSNFCLTNQVVCPVDSLTAWICWLNPHCIFYHVLLFLIFSANWWFLFHLKLSVPVLNEWVDEKTVNLEILESVLGGTYFSPSCVWCALLMAVLTWQLGSSPFINKWYFIRICWNESSLLLEFWLLQGEFFKNSFCLI